MRDVTADDRQSNSAVVIREDDTHLRCLFLLDRHPRGFPRSDWAHPIRGPWGFAAAVPSVMPTVRAASPSGFGGEHPE